MELVDTHCHIHFKNYGLDSQEALKAATEAQVNRIICVGTTLVDSRLATEFAGQNDNVWATVGVHPHDAAKFLGDKTAKGEIGELLRSSNIVAVGEVGLDYFKGYSGKKEQKQVFRFQVEAGLPTGLPFVFHVRDAWEDFFEIFDSYPALQGVVHSFSATRMQLEQILSRGLYVGLNGIMTFSQNKQQLEAARQIPQDRLLLETDAPFLTPKPFRGDICEPKHTRVVAEFLAGLRGEPLEVLAKSTTQNAVRLFKLV